MLLSAHWVTTCLAVVSVPGVRVGAGGSPAREGETSAINAATSLSVCALSAASSESASASVPASWASGEETLSDSPQRASMSAREGTSSTTVRTVPSSAVCTTQSIWDASSCTSDASRSTGSDVAPRDAGADAAESPSTVLPAGAAPEAAAESTAPTSPTSHACSCLCRMRSAAASVRVSLRDPPPATISACATCMPVDSSHTQKVPSTPACETPSGRET